MVLSGKVMAFRNVFMEDFSSSTKGSFTGNLSLPHRTECSRMWNTPVESSGRVLKPMQNSLLVSPLSTQTREALVLSWVISTRFALSSATSRTRVTVKPCSFWPVVKDISGTSFHIEQHMLRDSFVLIRHGSPFFLPVESGSTEYQIQLRLHSTCGKADRVTGAAPAHPSSHSSADGAHPAPHPWRR